MEEENKAEENKKTTGEWDAFKNMNPTGLVFLIIGFTYIMIGISNTTFLIIGFAFIGISFAFFADDENKEEKEGILPKGENLEDTITGFKTEPGATSVEEETPDSKNDKI